MKWPLALILSACAFISGCTYNLSRPEYETEEQFLSDINETSDGRNVRIETKDSTFDASEITSGENSLKGTITHYYFITTYDMRAYEREFSLPNSAIHSVSVTKRTSSIASGAGIGALTGIVLGWFVADLISTNTEKDFPEPGIAAEIGVFPGAFIGGIIGGLVGDDYVFDYRWKQNRENLFRDNASRKYGIRLGYHQGFKTFFVRKSGYSVGPASMVSSEVPGFSLTAFYNYKLGKNFSLNNELSFTSAGSDEKYGVYTSSQSYIPVTSTSVESMKIIELAPLIRLNLFKSGFTPYFLMGPRFDLVFPSSAAQEDFYSAISRQYGGNIYNISGRYKRSVWGAVLGAGLSTGKLLPYELLLELRFNFDVTNRFEISYNGPQAFDGTSGHRTIAHRSKGIIINAGIAIN